MTTNVEKYQKAEKKAYAVYLKALNDAEGDLINAAIAADRKGYNWTCDFQDCWYRAVSNCEFTCYE